MDWLTFVSKFIESVSWPLAVTAGVYFLRTELRDLVPFIKRLKAGPLEAEFERALQEVAEDIPTVAPNIQGPRLQLLNDLVRINPRSAIVEAWIGIDAAVRKAALQRIASSPPPDVSSPLRAMRALVQHGIISADDAALFQDLRGLRNQAAHSDGFAIHEGAASKYIEMAAGLEARLQHLATPFGN